MNLHLNRLTLPFITIIFLFCSCSSNPSKDESLKLISSQIKRTPELYNNLDDVTKNAPARMSSSENNAKAVSYWTEVLARYEVDSVWKQKVTVPNWTPGETFVYLNLPENGRQLLVSTPLGTSVGTKGKNLTASVIEIKSREELERAKVKGKIVFFNMVMDDSVNTYSAVWWQRALGPSEASKKGAVAAIVRSLTTDVDNDPHTGSTHFEEGVKKIPAISISTLSANSLSASIRKNPNRKITINSTSMNHPDGIGENVIAEIKGSTSPTKIILISAHLDSWYNSEGANDNAAGCSQAVEILRAFATLRSSKVLLNHTLRIILYQDEEIGLSGMKKYASQYTDRVNNSEPMEKGWPSKSEVVSMEGIKEQHLFEIELDSGAGLPRNILMYEPQQVVDNLNSKLTPYLSKEFGFKSFISIGNPSEADWPLAKADGTPLYYFRADTPNYFSLHHSSKDNMETIEINNFKTATAAVASFVYLMDKGVDAL